MDKYINWKNIIIHHSLTKDGIVADWEGIRKYHIEFNKWSDIGYHFGIENVNYKEIYRIGRPLSMVGGHTKGMNEKSIGICLVGNYDEIIPTIQQYSMLANLCNILCDCFNIPKSNIYRHSDYAPKSCPGKYFKMEEMLKYI